MGVEILDYYNDVNLAGPYPFQKQSHTDVSPYASINLKYAYADSGNLSFGFQHSHNQTDVAANASNLSQGVTLDQETSTIYATLSQKLTPVSPRLVGSLTAQYQDSVYNEGPFDNETDNYYLFGVNLNYQFNQYLSAECGWPQYDLICSDVPGRAYNRNQVFFGVAMAY